MGFRSGDQAGQSRSSTLFSRNHAIVRADLWQGALSCWNLPVSMFLSPKSFVNEGRNAVSSKFMYLEESMRPSHTNNSPTPESVMQLQTIMLSPPCFTVGTTHTGLKSSPTRRRTEVTTGVPKICYKETNIEFQKTKELHLCVWILNHFILFYQGIKYSYLPLSQIRLTTQNLTTLNW